MDGKAVPVQHWGVILEMDEWEKLAERLRSHGVTFVIEPYIRFKGEVGEQATMFLLDPSVMHWNLRRSLTMPRFLRQRKWGKMGRRGDRPCHITPRHITTHQDNNASLNESQNPDKSGLVALATGACEESAASRETYPVRRFPARQAAQTLCRLRFRCRLMSRCRSRLQRYRSVGPQNCC